MRPIKARGAVAVWYVLLFALASVLSAQETATAPNPSPKHIGVPQDWSQHHIVFSRDGLAKHPDLMEREPRIAHQATQRWQLPKFGSFESAESAEPLNVMRNVRSHRDWNETVTGHLFVNAFPAKYSFFPDATPSCSTDYVVFGLTSNGTNGRPNLVGFNNLYSNPSIGGGLCDPAVGPFPGPTVLFAYNITTPTTLGHIITSPILSLDGTKIGFVESIPANAMLLTPSMSIFHVLTWTAGDGNLTTGAIPLNMTSLVLSPIHGDTRSSPWIDYANDVVYVGADDGNLYKITGVFNGVPTIAVGWPVTLNASTYHLSSPVLDQNLGVLMVGSASGDVYEVDANSGAILETIPVGSGFTPGIAAAPIVDPTNGTTFVVTANDGMTGAALVELRTANGVQLSSAELGLGAGTPTCNGCTQTALNLYEPAFSNDYFNYVSGGTNNGVATLCGTGADDTTPWQYVFGFTGAHLNESPSFKQQLLVSTAARCTGWTEFFNPNIGGGTDFFFFGMSQDCDQAGGGAPAGCVAEFTNLTPATNSATPTIAFINGGPSGIVVDNYSVLGQASSIYFTAIRTSTAYKFTQDGLQ